MLSTTPLAASTEPSDTAAHDPADDVHARVAARLGAIEPPHEPSVVVLLRAAATKGAELSVLAALVDAEPALAAVIKGLAVAHGRPRGLPVSAAVEALGAHRVVFAAIAWGLSAPARRQGPFLAARRRLWRGCVASSLVAEALAGSRRVPGGQAALGGLVHAYGKILALASVEDALAKAGTLGSLDANDWLLVIEGHHRAVSARVAEAWHLAVPLAVEVVPTGALPLADLFATCDAVVTELGESAEITIERYGALESVRSWQEAALIARALAKLSDTVSALATPPPSVGPAAARGPARVRGITQGRGAGLPHTRSSSAHAGSRPASH